MDGTMTWDRRICELLAVNQAIAGTLDYDDVLRLVVDKAAALFSATACVLILSGADQRARVVASVGVRKELADAFDSPLDEHLGEKLGVALDIKPQELFLGVPVILRGRIEGVLVVFRRVAESCDDEHLLLSALGDQAAIALDNAERFKALRETLRAREQAEEASRTIGERLRRLLEDTSESVFLADLDGYYTEVNRAGCELLRRPREEILGRNITDFSPPEAVERLWQIREQLLAGGRCVVEWKLQRKDGTFVPVEMSTGILADGRWHAFIRDITERKRVEREQQFLAEVWETLVSSLDYRETLRRAGRLALGLLGDVCTIDLMGADNDVSARRVVALHADSDKAELVHKLEQFPPDRRFPCTTWKVVESRHSLLSADYTQGEMRRSMVQSDEHRRVLDAIGMQSVIAVPLLSRGQLLGVLTIASCRAGRRYDASDLRLAEELARRAALALDNVRLYQESHLLAAITANLAEGVIMVCTTNFTIVYANTRFEQMFGYGPRELIGKPIHTLNAPGDLEPAERSAQIVDHLSRENPWHGENENVRKDGTTFFCYASVSAFEHPELGRVWICMYTDITERKRLEEANLCSLREKEVLLKEVHHRVKNNLQIISSLFYLQRQRATAPQIKSLLDEGRSRIQAIALIHEQLYQSASLAIIDLDDYLRRLTAALRSMYGARKVEIETCAAGVALELEQAVPCALLISELVSNSLKHAFASHPGRVSVRARRAADGEIILEAADDGAGIPESLDWRNAGSLGLQLVQSLVKQLRGTIELNRSAGTCFIVRFRAP